MSKNILQDIKPLTSSTRRRVPNSVNYEENTIPTTNLSKEGPRQPRVILPENEHPKRKKGFLLLIIIIFVISGLAVSLLHYFGKATITIEAKNFPLELKDMAITAYTNPKEGELPFEIMIVPGEESTTIEAKDKTKVERQAKGTVILYNNFSSSAQNLKIDTRLETADGLIYKTDKAVIIPGTTTKSGVVTPGQIEVGIYAEKVGTTYNSDKELEMKILGFKGSAKYDKFYAKTKGNITGGQSGEMYTISANEASSARDSLDQKLKDKLLENAKVQIPPGYMFFENGLNYDLEPNTNNPIDSVEKNIPIVKKGSLAVVLFNEKELSKYLTKNSVSQFEDGDVYIPEIKTLSFAFKDNDNLLLKDAKSISFKLSGSGKIIYNIDKESIMNALKNKKKSEFKSIFALFPSINSAEIKLTPPWRRTFPSSNEDVSIIVN